ncbi:hypothetical protein C2W62_43100 [Candidatus Entotheonella serta]|nr:hypothetical protein C2W62_43100 [Candidatus Entotheonella serta]
MEYRTQNDYMIRAGVPDDVPQIVSLFNEVYGESSHPCRHPDFVRASLQHDIWRVALAGSEIVACSAGMWHSWNQLYERGRSVTHPEFRTHGLGRRVLDAVLEAMWAQPRCDLVVGYPRSDVMTRLLFKEMSPPFIIVGHDGGMNVADGMREYHLIGMNVNPHHQPLRIIPPGPTCYSTTFIEGQLLPRLTFHTREEAYPPADIVGPSIASRAHSRSWSIGYQYDPGGESLQVTDLDGQMDDPERRLDALASCLEEAPEATHRWMYVLYDKTDFILGMQDLGFQVSAFLPGWFYTERARYDCVLLTQCISPEPPVAQGTQEFINLFDSTLNHQTTLA